MSGGGPVCATHVTGVSTDTDDVGDRERIEKIDVQVLGEVLDAIGEEYS